MNRQTAPTDWKGSVMQSRIAKRYAAERRFKLFGLGAVLLSGAFLAFLLFVMVGNGARGFTYTHVAVPVDFKAMPLTIDTSRLGDADADQVIANAGLSDIVAFAADEALGNGGSDLISENAWKEVRSQIKDDPELLNGKTVFELPASSAVDIAAKEGARARSARRSRHWGRTASCRPASTGPSSRMPMRPILRLRASGARSRARC